MNSGNGTPKTSDDLFAFLSSLGISFENSEHDPVFTVGESQANRDGMHGGHTKNLFLKDKKGRYFLLTVLEDAQIDLKTIHHAIGAQGRVSFGKSEALIELLGVRPGSVTAFGILNDTDNAVTLVLDEALMNHKMIYAHPLRNDATTGIAASDLVKFVKATGHDVVILPVDQNHHQG